MKFCSNCGFKCSDDSVFCSNCGKEVNSNIKENKNTTVSDGNKTSTSNSISKDENNTISNNNIDDICKNVKEAFSNNINMDYIIEGGKAYYEILKNPVKQSKSFIENNNKTTTIVTLIISLILQGLLCLWRFIKVDNAFGFSSYFSTNKIKVFFYGLLFATVICLVIFASLCIFKKSINNKSKLLRIIIVASIYLIEGWFISILASYVSEKVSIFILVFTLLISIGSLFNNHSKHILEGESSALQMSISLTITLVVLTLIFSSIFDSVSNNFLSNIMGFGRNIKSLIP